MPDRSCDCFSKTEADKTCDIFINFLFAGVIIICLTTSYVIDKTTQNRGKINELFSRLEECEKNHESSHELKK